MGLVKCLEHTECIALLCQAIYTTFPDCKQQQIAGRSLGTRLMNVHVVTCIRETPESGGTLLCTYMCFGHDTNKQ